MTWENRLQTARQQHLAGQLHVAEPAYREILRERPQQPDALFLLGCLALQRDEHARAAGLLEQAARLDSANADACNNYGLALFHLGRLAEAAVQYERALRRRPDFSEALSNLGLCRYRQKLIPEAAAALERALAFKPDYADAHNNLGIVRQDQGRLDEAIACLRRALALRPDYAEAHSNLARALRHHGDPESAIEHAQRALALNPGLVKTYGVLGNCYLDEGKIDAVFEALRLGLAWAPEDAELNWNLSIVELLSGHFPKAWHDYEWRFRTNPELERPFRQPRWDGTVHPGQRLLVHAEQGLGDTIQFARYLPLVKARVGDAMEIVFECQRPLARLLHGFPGIDPLVVREDDARVAAPFDLHAPLLSLPGFFGTTLDTVPTPPALTVDPDESRPWAARLGPLSGLKVGLVWAGNPDHRGDRQRSMALSQLAPLAAVNGVKLLSLQKGRDAEIRQHGASLNLVELGSQFSDFTATAAAIANLDLVISVDTAVAHLAATLGKPTWILLPFSPDWRWLLGREDSPWYPSVRLFRQPRRGDWESVVRAVAQALATLAKKNPACESAEPTPRRSVTATSPAFDADAEADRALKLHRAGELVQAETIYRAVLTQEPEHPQALYLLGSLKAQNGRWMDAVELLQRAAVARPDHPDTHGNLAIALQNQDRLDEAIVHFRKAIALCPTFAEGHNNLGVALQAKSLHEDAECCFRDALGLRPDYPEALVNLGNVHERRDEWEPAAECYRRALALRPDYPEAQASLGHVLCQSGKIEEAILHGEQAVVRRPELVEAQNFLGVSHLEAGSPVRAIECFRAALARDPEHAKTRHNLGLAHLLAGDFAPGWEGYEWRFQANPALGQPLPLPAWDGSPLAGKSILIHAEQGVGDEIMFASCLPEIVRTAKRCVLTCDRRLVKLFRRSFPDVEVIGVEVVDGQRENAQHWLPRAGHIDFQCPLGSLPRFLRLAPECFPAHGGYLRADTRRVAAWRERLACLGDGPKIGFSWRGGSATAQRTRRSIPLASCGELLTVPGVHFANLQYGDTGLERQHVRNQLGIDVHHWENVNPLSDLDEFAALTTALDLVITVANATAHMAGALSVPVWVLTPFAPDWRWQLARADSPWYPSARLFRQGRADDLESAIAAVSATLRQQTGAGARP